MGILQAVKRWLSVPKPMSEKEFNTKEVKLVITPKAGCFNKTYYIKDMQLFKLILNKE